MIRKKIILASASPRRKELLSLLGVKFKVVPSKTDEKLNPRLKPRAQVEELARQKAHAVATRVTNSLVIAADTIVVVVVVDEILGKPSSTEDAKRMIRKLNGREHKVMSGFTIMDTETKREVTKSVVSRLFMKKLSRKEIDAYIAKEENLFDKAGAYAIQLLGAVLFEKIEGDYYNIVGLPISLLSDELKRFGIHTL